ncbi:MAG TPA: hypothetical protein VLE43_20375, partial [Candidatus Saccharimonadia bacterium]|nr:hypothetical protein [Candidatus Saccharimonadia bacterium]
MRFPVMRAMSLSSFVLLMACFGSVPMLGNGGGYTKGLASTGAFKPFGIEQVEMLSERLEVDLHIEYAEVRIEYVLHNPGPKVTVEAGFPVAVPRDMYFGAQPQTWTGAKVALQDFELAADGKPVKIAIVEDDLRLSGPHTNSPLEGDKVVKGWRASMVKGWHVFKLDFARGQTRRVSVRYCNPYFYSYTHVSESVSMSE